MNGLYEDLHNDFYDENHDEEFVNCMNYNSSNENDLDMFPLNDVSLDFDFPNDFNEEESLSYSPNMNMKEEIVKSDDSSTKIPESTIVQKPPGKNNFDETNMKLPPSPIQTNQNCKEEMNTLVVKEPPVKEETEVKKRKKTSKKKSTSSQKRSTGRKRKREVSSHPTTQKEKEELRRMKNRESARASRERRKKYISDLEVSNKSLSKNNSSLIRENQNLLLENQLLRENLMRMKQMQEFQQLQQRRRQLQQQQMDYSMEEPPKKKRKLCASSQNERTNLLMNTENEKEIKQEELSEEEYEDEEEENEKEVVKRRKRQRVVHHPAPRNAGIAANFLHQFARPPPPPPGSSSTSSSAAPTVFHPFSTHFWNQILPSSVMNPSASASASASKMIRTSSMTRNGRKTVMMFMMMIVLAFFLTIPSKTNDLFLGNYLSSLQQLQKKNQLFYVDPSSSSPSSSFFQQDIMNSNNNEESITQRRLLEHEEEVLEVLESHQHQGERGEEELMVTDRLRMLYEDFVERLNLLSEEERNKEFTIDELLSLLNIQMIVDHHRQQGNDDGRNYLILEFPEENELEVKQEEEEMTLEGFMKTLFKDICKVFSTSFTQNNNQ